MYVKVCVCMLGVYVSVCVREINRDREFRATNLDERLQGASTCFFR